MQQDLASSWPPSPESSLQPDSRPDSGRDGSSRSRDSLPGNALPRFVPAAPAPAAWGLSRLLGNLVEISGSAVSGVLSSALMLVAEAQRDENHHGLVAWVATTGSLFYPPDAVDAGVALERLILLRLESPAAQVRAATRITRSGAFGLVVVDLADATRPRIHGASPFRKAPCGPEIPPLSRLAGLARKTRSALVLLTEKRPAAPSLDPRVGMRYDASREGSTVAITVIKDKGSRGFPSRLSPGFRFERRCREPAGMC